MTQETINAAKAGDEKAIAEITESVRYTFLSVLSSNRNGFAHSYQIEDFKEDFPTIVWEAIKLYDPSRGCVFNTFFHSHVFWIIGKQKRRIALGMFETPLTGVFEDDEMVAHVLDNLESDNEPVPGQSIDLDYLRNQDFHLNEPETFLIEKILSGSNMKEAIDDFELTFGKSRQWAYICRDSAIKKIQKHATKQP